MNFNDLKLRTFPHRDLETKCLDVQESEFGTFELEALCATMIEIMRELSGLGLAANQLGINKRIFVYENKAAPENAEEVEHEFPEIFINPSIKKTNNTIEMKATDGCLSFPGCYTKSTRPTNYEITYQDLEGNQHTIPDDVCCDYYGFIFHHEISHLEGKTILDYTDFVQSDKIIKRMNKLRKKL
jgi:peptide deformylase